MTATSSGSGGSGAGGAWRWVLPLIAAVVLTVLVLPSNDEGERFDLDSAQPAGYRGLRLLLEETGTTTVDRIDAGDVSAETVERYDTVFIPAGGAAGEDLADQWRGYVEAGGRLVLGSPSAWIGAPAATIEFGTTFFDGVDADGTLPTGECDLGELADAGAVAVPFLVDGVDASGGDSCYGDGATALVVRQPEVAGEVVTLASPELFTNEVMGAPQPEEPVGPIPGNAVVAQRLLGQGIDVDGNPGRRLGIVTTGVDEVVVPGEKSLLDFMSSGVKLGLLELGVAFLFYAWFRGRRHGKVVVEPAPVEIAGSSFVEAVGSLLERQGDVPRAVEVLRAGQCRELARRFGLPRTVGRPELAAVVAARTAREPAAVLALLTDPVDTEADLVSLTRELDSLRQEALHV